MNEKRTWFEIGWKPLDSGEEHRQTGGPPSRSLLGASPESSGSEPHDHDGTSASALSTGADGTEPLE